VWRKDSSLLSLPLVGFGLVAPLAFLGVALGGFERRRRSILILSLAAVAAQNLLFFVTGRYRLEAVPVLCVLAGLGVDRALAVGLRQIPLRVGIATLLLTAFVFLDLLGERAIDPVRAAINRGVAHRRSGFHASATRSYREALRVDPKDPDAHRLLGEISLEEGDWDRAPARYESALRAAPDYLMALLGKAQTLEKSGRRPEAEEVYRHTLTIDPWSFEVRLNYGVFLGMEGRTAEARRMLEEGRRLAPRDERFGANLANLDRIEALQK
jgi:tetratricopeptide (TPR) repeat protein